MKTRDTIIKVLFVIASIILTGALWRLFSTTGQGQAATDGDPRTQIILSALYGLVAILAALQFRRTMQAFWQNPVLIALSLLACVSALWAETPDVVFRRAIGLFGTTLFGIVLMVYYPFEDQLKIFRWAYRIGTTATLLLFIVSPSRILSAPGGGGGIRGVFPHKNILGAAMALAFLVEWYLREHDTKAKFLRLIFLSIYGVLLLASDSMTSVVTVIASLGTLWAFRVLYTRFQIPLAVLALFLLTAVGAISLAGVRAGDVLGLIGRSSDLTGRTELWSAVLDVILERPILGFGFSGFWKGASSSAEAVQGQIRWTPAYSHNGYLEITLSLGIVGLFLAVWMLSVGLKRAWRRAHEGGSALDGWPLALFVFVVIHNAAECSIAWQNCLEWSVCVATIVGCSPRWHGAFAADQEIYEEAEEESPAAEEEYA